MLRHDPCAGLSSTVELRDERVPIARVFGLLANCTDVVPNFVLSEIADVYEMHAREDLPRMRCTYAAAARLLLRVLD